jgi:drug/metabolite transporter (DMT)-like permease
MSDPMQSVDERRSPTVADEGRRPWDGPFLFAAALGIGGLLFFAFGSVTIVPWIEAERTPETVRSIWVALSRNLPELGPDALVRAGFWMLIAVIAVLGVAVMLMASTVRDDVEPGNDTPA